jgi:hypothetical protein
MLLRYWGGAPDPVSALELAGVQKMKGLPSHSPVKGHQHMADRQDDVIGFTLQMGGRDADLAVMRRRQDPKQLGQRAIPGDDAHGVIRRRQRGDGRVIAPGDKRWLRMAEDGAQYRPG